MTLKNYQGSAVLKKTDEVGKTLAGAQFNLQHAKLNTGDFSDYGNQKSYITDNNGQLNLTGLAPGKYKLKESKEPEGYYLNTEEIAFEIPQIATGNEAPI
ncbi:prealbumin-like fold domain-containing protein [Enterococcus durans]|nr:prealbumin-like fold domain-containing protein [Enterococcus durans]